MARCWESPETGSLVDEVSRFLVFLSYFDGIQRPAAVLNADLDYLSKQGIDGIRVLPNWKAQLFGTDGTVHRAALEKLVGAGDRGGSPRHGRRRDLHARDQLPIRAPRLADPALRVLGR